MSYIKNWSLRFRASNSAYASLTPAAGTQDKYKLLLRLKRGTLSAQQCLLSAGSSGDDQIYFNSSDKLCWDFAGTNRLVSTRVFRDPAAHMTMEIIYDAGNGTAAQKARVFVSEHGEPLTEITAWDTDTRSSITTGTSKINTNVPHNIGRRLNGTTNYFDGYFDEVALVDNSASSGFSITTDATTGATVPVAVTGAKWWLTFESNASTAALGTDSGSDGVSWTMNNFSVTAGVTNDSLKDVAQNSGTDLGNGGEVGGNYCTLNPLAQSGATLSNGNLKESAAAACTVLGTMAFDGASYWEDTVSYSTTGYGYFGVQIINNPIVASTSLASVASSQYIWRDDGNKANNGASSAFGTGLTSGQTGMVAYDKATGKLWFGAQGTWFGSGNPATGANPAYTLPAGTDVLPLVGAQGATGAAIHDVNFGQRPFAYTAPTGFKAPCTQNLPDPAILKPSSEFATVIDTETNIDATLAAASAWTDYVRILKNRTNSETWAWQFSHDTSNEYAVSTTATRQTKRTNSGTDNWVGYGIKVNGTAGVKAGAVVFTTGADATVTHNSGISARQLILLFPRAGGDVMVYHPDLTSGKLLKLNSTAAEATSATIKTVGANSFVIDGGTGSGTYDYLVIPELSGFFKLGKHTGNASADGPFDWANLSPMFSLIRRTDSTTDWFLLDVARAPSNPATGSLSLDTGSAEGADAPSSSHIVDFISNGVKMRGTGGAINASGGIYATAMFAKLPFKYLTSPYVSPTPAGPDFSALGMFCLP